MIKFFFINTGFIEIVKKLVESHADVNLKDDSDRTPADMLISGG